MSCLIGSSNVKIFGKAFHALSKIADDLYMEALPSGLVFHTVNSSKSAYACFTFKTDFFISYKDDAVEKRKILLKSCLMAFRSLPNLEKNVEKCLFDISSAADYLLLKFFCKHSMIKVYQLNYVENETVQGSFPTSGFTCKLTAPSRLLLDSIQNFSTAVEEITLTVGSNKVFLKNYVDDEPDPNKVVHTEMTLESEEFDLFEVEEETKITFCLKELKAILNFCEGFSVPVAIKCQSPGRPVNFSINGLRGVDVQFVLATLADRDTQLITSSGSVFRTSVAQNSQHVDKVSTLNEKLEASPSLPPASNTASSSSKDNSIPKLPYEKPKFSMLLSDEEDDDLTSSISLCQAVVDEGDDDMVPSSPPNKKFRSLFLGLSQDTYTSMAPDPDEVLVPNSDDEG
uniref:Cell cycle checkpoint control protein n=1 Tax=Parasteatoda tepidariorum TaxID=114398 RepID=A0A2L2YG25_PARTP